MHSFLKRTALLAALALHPPGASAAEPVKHIRIYVQPYYEAGRTADERPQVAVGESLSGMLGSNRREDILAARDTVVAAPKLVTPMTLMVLAIRLYDVGLRDDAVFWFYAAKDRFITLADVIGIRASGMMQAEEAVRSFATLAGPVINSYAFCDLARQKALRLKAFEWVEQNPYGVIFMDRFTAKPGNRADNLKLAMRNVRLNIDKEQAYLQDPKNVENFYATRRKNEAEEKFCWQ
jgi:hypothetical protein